MFIVTELGRRDRERDRPPRGPLDPLLTMHAQIASETFERDGQTGLKNYLDQVEDETALNGFLFNRELQELSERSTPAKAREVAQRAWEGSQPQRPPNGAPPPFSAHIANTFKGNSYVFVAQLPGPHHHGLATPIVHMIAVTLLGMAFCYGLAWYLTIPVKKLRVATRELAGGNLAVRVSPTLGSRKDELTELANDFDVMAEKIEGLITSQRRLLGDISHELRSPLARLIVALELARQRSGTEARTALDRIELEAENLNELIGQLLALTRLEAGTQHFEQTDFELAELVRQIVDDADFEATSRNCSVTLASVQDCKVQGNYELLRRAIENVVRNAVQHTAQGTEVAVSMRSEVRSNMTRCVITVRDHGPGVPEESLKKIFTPFYRVDEARNREAGGAGLGLAIADRAVGLHRGEIIAANATDGGLIVNLTFPAK